MAQPVPVCLELIYTMGTQTSTCTMEYYEIIQSRQIGRFQVWRHGMTCIYQRKFFGLFENKVLLNPRQSRDRFSRQQYETKWTLLGLQKRYVPADCTFYTLRVKLHGIKVCHRTISETEKTLTLI